MLQGRFDSVSAPVPKIRSRNRLSGRKPHLSQRNGSIPEHAIMCVRSNRPDGLYIGAEVQMVNDVFRKSHAPDRASFSATTCRMRKGNFGRTKPDHFPYQFMFAL